MGYRNGVQQGETMMGSIETDAQRGELDSL